jgi:hypothetical protein
MRAFVQRLLPLAVVALAAVLSGRASAQSDSTPGGAAENRLEAAAADALTADATGATEQPDEVTVEGRKNSNELGRYLLEMTKAKNKIVEVFNEVNSTDDNDVKCRNERPTGTRLGHTVCRSKAEEAANASAAKGFLDALLRSSGGYITNTRGSRPPAGGAQINALVGTSKAQQGMAAEEARVKLEAELKKLMAENRELFRATVKYVEARDAYNTARGRGTVVYGSSPPGDASIDATIPAGASTSAAE